MGESSSPSYSFSNTSVLGDNLRSTSDDAEILVLQEELTANKSPVSMGSRTTRISSSIDSISWNNSDISPLNSSYKLPAMSSFSSVNSILDSNSSSSIDFLQSENQRLQSTVDSNMSYILNQKKHYSSLLNTQNEKLLNSQRELDVLRANHDLTIKNYERKYQNLSSEIETLKEKDLSTKATDVSQVFPIKEFDGLQGTINELRTKAEKLKNANTELSKANEDLVESIKNQASSQKSLNDLFYKLSQQENNFKLLIENILERESGLKSVVKKLEKRHARYKKCRRSPSYIIKLAARYLTETQLQLLQVQLKYSKENSSKCVFTDSDEAFISDSDDADSQIANASSCMNKVTALLSKNEFNTFCRNLYTSAPQVYDHLSRTFSFPAHENLLRETDSTNKEDMSNILNENITSDGPPEIKRQHLDVSSRYNSKEKEISNNLPSNIEDFEEGMTCNGDEMLTFSDSEPEFIDQDEEEYIPSPPVNKNDSQAIHSLHPLNGSQQMPNVIQRAYFSVPSHSHNISPSMHQQVHHSQSESAISEVPHRPYLQVASHEPHEKVHKNQCLSVNTTNHHFNFPPDAHIIHASVFNPAIHTEAFDLAYSSAPIGTRVDSGQSMPLLIHESPISLHTQHGRQQIPLVVSSMGQPAISNTVTKHTKVDEVQHLNPSGSKMVFRVLQ